MKINDLKKQLVEESKSFVPDMKNKIYASVGYSKKPKTRLKLRLKPVLTFVVLLFLSLSIFIEPSVIANSFVIIEINPAFELEVNQDNKVVSVNPLNTDGYFFLEEFDVNNLLLDTALEKIVNQANLKGYLQTEMSKMSVSAVNANKNTEEYINSFIKTKVETIKPGVIKINEELIAEAKTYNVSPGRILIIKRAMEVDKSLTIEDALERDVKDLVAIMNKNVKDKVDKFEDQYKSNIVELKNKKANYLNQLELRKAVVEAKIEELEELVDFGMEMVDFQTFININFDEYKLNSLDIDDLEDILEDIEDFYDEHFDFLEDIIEDNFDNQEKAYKEKVNENSKNNKEDFSLEFDDEFQFNKYHNRYTEEEKEVIQIINKLIALINNKYPGINNRINDLYEEYLDKIEDLTVEFLNNEIVKKFEEDYADYLNDVVSSRSSINVDIDLTDDEDDETYLWWWKNHQYGK